MGAESGLEPLVVNGAGGGLEKAARVAAAAVATN